MSQTSNTLRDVGKACGFYLLICIGVIVIGGMCLYDYLRWRVSDGAA